VLWLEILTYIMNVTPRGTAHTKKHEFCLLRTSQISNVTEGSKFSDTGCAVWSPGNTTTRSPNTKHVHANEETLSPLRNLKCSSVAFQVDWIKGKSNFHPQHFKHWTDFQALHNKNISIWIPITLISLSMPLLRRSHFSQGIKTHATLYSGFVISYEAILTLQLPAK